MNTKSLILGVAVMGLAASSFAQGTISFANATTSLISTNNGTTSGVARTTTGTVVELFYQVGSSTAPAPLTSAALTGTLRGWEPVYTDQTATTVAGAKSISGLSAGKVIGGGVSTGTDVAPAGNVWLEVVAWTGGTVGQAVSSANSGAAGFLFGVSNVFSQGTGDGLSIPAVQITGMNAFSLVPIPEPTTIAVAGLGAASLLLFRRRK